MRGSQHSVLIASHSPVHRRGCWSPSAPTDPPVLHRSTAQLTHPLGSPLHSLCSVRGRAAGQLCGAAGQPAVPPHRLCRPVPALPPCRRRLGELAGGWVLEGLEEGLVEGAGWVPMEAWVPVVLHAGGSAVTRSLTSHASGTPVLLLGGGMGPTLGPQLSADTAPLLPPPSRVAAWAPWAAPWTLAAPSPSSRRSLRRASCLTRCVDQGRSLVGAGTGLEHWFRRRRLPAPCISPLVSPADACIASHSSAQLTRALLPTNALRRWLAATRPSWSCRRWSTS